MDTKKKWITFGALGVVGLGVLAGGAAATAASMDLQTTDGTVLPGGAITGRESGVLDRSGVQMSVSDTSVTIVSAPTPAPAASPASVASPTSVVSPVTPPAPAPPAPAPAPGSPASIPSAASAASVASVASAGSN